jgi:hypothetical protein
VPEWCVHDRLADMGGVWRSLEEGGVVCDAPGVYIVDGAIRFVLPRCYDAAPPEGITALHAALVLLRAMARYRIHPKRRAVDDAAGDITLREVGAVDDALGWLETCLLLVEDAQRNGALYVATTDVSPHRQGRIHWTKTQQYGFHVVDGAEVLTSPFWRSRHGIDPEDPLTQLHGDTCAGIRRALGRGARDGHRWTPAKALSVLDRRDHTLYADRHRIVARWLRQYWTSASGVLGSRRSGVSALWSPTFPLVWEEMLRAVMGGRAFGMPGGTYSLATGTQSGLRLIPDFVIDSGPLRIVVDAKHYGLDDLPRTESLAKQLLYRWFASRESGHGEVALADVVSVFILPAVGRQARLDVLGTHELDGEAAVPRAFGRVGLIAADFETVAEAYASGKRLEDLVLMAGSFAGI